MRLGKLAKGLCTVFAIGVGLYFSAAVTFAAGTGKATDDGVRIRSSASASGEVIGSSTKGNKMDIFAKTKDSDGNTWYKVTVSGDTKGYIRADYVTDVQGDIPSEGGDSSSTSASTTEANDQADTTSTAADTTEATTTVVNPSSYSFGTTSGEVSVRESPSTKANKVATTATNQDVAITGEATGSDGMVWYQVNYGDITGFIRSDLITPGSDEQEAVEETPIEDAEVPVEVEEPAAVSNDYELRFEPNNEGVDVWWLYDNVKGTRQTLDNIFAVMNQNQELANKESEKSPLKTVVIIMGVIMVLLVIAVFVLIFKLKDSYEDWDEEEEDEDDHPIEDVPVEEPEEEDEELDDEDIKIVTKRGKAKKATTSTKPAKSSQNESWKSNKFFEIDDDVEFEFLDIDK